MEGDDEVNQEMRVKQSEAEEEMREIQADAED